VSRITGGYGPEGIIDDDDVTSPDEEEEEEVEEVELVATTFELPRSGGPNTSNFLDGFGLAGRRGAVRTNA
jgi:hypothetical protein